MVSQIQSPNSSSVMLLDVVKFTFKKNG